jgi:hypothetical protein
VIWVYNKFVGTVSDMVTCCLVIRSLSSKLYFPHTCKNKKQLVEGADYTTLMPKSVQSCDFLWRIKNLRA